uniref:Cell death inducing DFFA like effector a n=1 Tax=Macaca nemestrina TaxID=9545 RepID=A0A2K6CPT6_MACNE
MEAARDYAGALIRPLTFMDHRLSESLLSPLTHPARHSGSPTMTGAAAWVMASSLQELISKTLDALVITTGLVTLVLEEDDNTHFMILEKGQKCGCCKHIPTCSPPKRSGIARVTFDLYRLNPKDFIGCLNGRPPCMRCTPLPISLCHRSLLRFLSYSAQVTGQFLVYMGTYMLRVLDDKEERPSLRSQVKGQFTCG